MKRLLIYYIKGLIVLVLFQSCDPERIFESNVEIPDNGWYRSEQARFSVNITDTVSGCDMYINIRNNSSYKYMDFWLFVNTSSPTGIVQRDTVKIMLADDHGKWLGHGLGNKYDNRILFRRNVRFPSSGTYIFEYEQGMRNDPVIGIDDIGLRIEQTKDSL